MLTAALGTARPPRLAVPCCRGLTAPAWPPAAPRPACGSSPACRSLRGRNFCRRRGERERPAAGVGGDAAAGPETSLLTKRAGHWWVALALHNTSTPPLRTLSGGWITGQAQRAGTACRHVGRCRMRNPPPLAFPLPTHWQVLEQKCGHALRGGGGGGSGGGQAVQHARIKQLCRQVSCGWTGVKPCKGKDGPSQQLPTRAGCRVSSMSCPCEHKHTRAATHLEVGPVVAVVCAVALHHAQHRLPACADTAGKRNPAEGQARIRERVDAHVRLPSSRQAGSPPASRHSSIASCETNMVPYPTSARRLRSMAAPDSFAGHHAAWV